MKAVMYHYVRPDNDEYPFFKFLHLDDFKRQLDYFSGKSRIAHPEEFRKSITLGQVPEGFLLTFDDGLKDHYKYVLPELLKRRLSAIFYVPTGMYLNNKLLDVHRVHLLLGKYGGYKIYQYLIEIVNDDMLSHAHVEEFKTITYNSQTNDDYTLLVKRIINYFISDCHRTLVMDKLMTYFFTDEKDIVSDFYITTEQIKEMKDAGMVIGSHTINHPVLSKLSFQQQKKEIIESFAFLENVTGGLPYRSFCFPYGGFHSFTNTTENILVQCDCSYSFNVEPRDVTMNDLIDRPQALPRYDCNMFPFGKTWQANHQMVSK